MQPRDIRVGQTLEWQSPGYQPVRAFVSFKTPFNIFLTFEDGRTTTRQYLDMVENWTLVSPENICVSNAERT